MSEIAICTKCNRVRIGDAEWSENPTTKTIKDAEKVPECDYCLEGIEIEEEEEEVEAAVIEVEAKDPDEIMTVKEMAFENHQCIIKTKKLMGEALLTFAGYLKDAKDNNYYGELGYESWNLYLSDPDIGIDGSRARRLIRLVNIKNALEASGAQVDFNEISEGRLTRLLLPCV